MNFTELKQSAAERRQKITNPPKILIFIGMGTCGKSAGAEETEANLVSLCKKKKVDFEIIRVGCAGLCHLEPLVDILKPNNPRICFGKVTVKNIPKIADYILRNKIPKGLVVGSVGETSIAGIPDLFEIPFMKRQVRRILKRCGFIDPENINHYIANDGYAGLNKALNMSPEEIIEEIKSSGLRGRGGAGFPTWKKWEFCRNIASETKFIICNADEGDPGAFMNRALLESDPHSVLEGMVIAGYTIGAREGYIYCRAEYPLALERIGIAIKQMQELNLLGEKILGSKFNFSIHVKEGAGAFVCGEETSLIHSIEGERGSPRARPPFPVEKGLFDCPTVINNVETLANVSHILQNNAGWFAQYGTEKSKGTKTFCLVGKIKNPGLIEIPLGTTLKEVIYDIGDGIADDKKFKAIQMGGPSGGCLPKEKLNLPIDYESLTAAGAIMGSGGMIIMDEDNCIVDLARYFLSFTQKESCGKCVPCRVGTKQMLNILEKVTKGLARTSDLVKLQELADTVKSASLCGLGQTAANPVLTTLKYFYDEYESHIDRECPAIVCKDLITAPCINTCPAEIDVPRYIRLLNDNKFSEAAVVIREKVPFPGVLGRVCYHPCEYKCARKDLDEPISIKTLKRAASDYDTGLWKKRLKKSAFTDKKVAIIGAGPSGLTAAYFLALKGHTVTVFESAKQPGGMLSIIPEYRLPKKILKKEIDDIKNIGVKIKTNEKINSLDKLFSDGFNAVFVATGAQSSIRLNIEGENEKGVINFMDFLRQAKLNIKPDVGNDVIIIGGGNAAIDCARTASRLGAKNVKIIYRRTQKEMPAYPEEIKSAFEENIKMIFLYSPKKIRKGSGGLNLECIKMKLGEVDNSGRRKPMPLADSEVIFNADTIIIAIGQEVETRFGIDLKRVDKKTLATDVKGVFIGGDCLTGPSSVIEAVAGGRKTASSIDKYLGGNGIIYKPLSHEQGKLEIPEITEKIEKRINAPCPRIKKRIKNFSEIEFGYDKKSAILESARCLKCDLGKAKQ